MDCNDAAVLHVFITPEAGGDMQEVNTVSAIEGRGLMGDRYYTLAGTFSKPRIEPDQEITLIEAEAFEELESNHGISLNYSQCRRNVITRGVDLNSLVGRTFQVGEVTVRGMRLCEPCTYLSGMTGHKMLVRLWRGRAGLRGQIVKSGKISAGDSITV